MSAEHFCPCRGASRLLTVAIAALGLLAALLALAAAQEFRTWTDSTGKHRIKAKFVGVSDGKVTLEREDGKQMTIPLEKLSPADQKHVTEMESDEASPFKEVTPAKTSPRKKRTVEEPAEEAEAAAGKTVTPRWAGVKEVLPAAAGAEWSLSIEAPEEPATRRSRPITIPPKTDFFERTKGLVVNPLCQRAVIGYVLDRPGRRDGGGQTRLVLCDLAKGKMIASHTAVGKMSPLALNDNGTQVLMRRDEFGFGNQDRLETWGLTEEGITKALQWTPHDDARAGERDIKWARYAAEDKLVTNSGGGKLTVWNAASAKPLYWLKIQGACLPALSPDRKYVAFATDKEVGVLDLGAGEVAALQPAPKAHFPFPVLAFTPKGTRLVCASFDRIYVWDAATGALYRDISLAGAGVHIGEHLLCPSEEHILVGNSLLIDIETQAKLWTYRGHELAAMAGGVCWFAVAGQGAGALVPTSLPHPAAKDKIQQAMASPDFFVLKPGVTVKVSTSALQDPGEREKAGAALAQKLEANGFVVGPNAAIELVATAEMGKRREISYRMFGSFGSKTYSVQEYISRVKFVYQGQTAWEVSVTSVPGFIHLKEGETIEQVLRRSERPNYDWFAKVELPKTLQKPTPGATTLGASQVTTAGVQ